MKKEREFILNYKDNEENMEYIFKTSIFKITLKENKEKKNYFYLIFRDISHLDYIYNLN